MIWAFFSVCPALTGRNSFSGKQRNGATIIKKAAKVKSRALKAVYFNDEAMANNILNCKTPQEAKQYGRCVRGYDENSWNKVRDEQMFIAVKAKYDSVFKFREFLNEHKDKKFAEASPYDKIWGIGLKETDTDATNPKRWLGENRLGKCIDRIIQENCNNGNS